MAILPFWDDTKKTRIVFHYVTVGLMAVCFGTFLLQLVQPAPDWDWPMVLAYGFIPVVSLGGESVPAVENLAWVTIVTYAFLHADWMHLLGNMLFLWVFGDNVEDRMGHIPFLVFYLICGAAAALFHGVLQDGSTAPLIGASGAISGVLAAYLIYYPKASVWALLMMRIPLKLPAWIVLGIWVAYNVVMWAVSAGSNAGPGTDIVAWDAHIGGFVVGLGLAWLLGRRPAPERRT